MRFIFSTKRIKFVKFLHINISELHFFFFLILVSTVKSINIK